MITNDLIEYIKSELSENVSKDSIIDSLLEAGWLRGDIDEGFSSIEVKPEVKKAVDQYRELPPEGDPLVLRIKAESGIEEKVVPIVKIPAEKKPAFDISKIKIEIPKTENPVVEAPVASISTTETAVPPIKEEPVKIWVPTTIKPVINEVKIETKEKERGLETYSLELPSEVKVVTNTIKSEPKKEELPIAEIAASEIKIEEKKEVVKEFIPVINKFSSYTIPKNSVNSMSDIVPKSAMISSYAEDLLTVIKKEDTPVPTKNRKRIIIKLGIMIIVIALISSMVFAFVSGYIKIPGSKSSFFVVKKDPKTILLNSNLNISKLKSFKTETNINIFSPSLSSITTGLSSGNAVNSTDKDSIIINAKGLVNHTNNKSISDYTFNFKSSVFKKDISTNIKTNGTDLYVSVPDLTQILGNSAPDPITLSTTRDQLDLIIKELPLGTQNLIKRLDVYNIISMETPLYVKNETASLFKEFINTFEYINKGEELVNNIDTYHYEVTVTRDSTKNLLGGLAKLFVPQLSEEEKVSLDEAFGSASISSFEIWIGKNDDNLYRIKYSLSAPLSKILRLNDSGIAGNEVKFDFMTTYYDLDVENKIVIPAGEINMEGFIKNIQSIKIKNAISGFKSQTTLLKNAIGSYGKSNILGSCTAPVAGSLFSPLGHPKGADTAVSSISSIMNSLLLVTKNEGYCYSTNKAWALSVPLKTTPISFYCSDNLGNNTTLLAPITGSVCSNNVVLPTSSTPVVPASTTPQL